MGEPGSAVGEWLLTNGLGGYALGPRSGSATRGYHGWLVAATAPPDGRVLYVGAIEACVVLDGVEHRLEELDLAAGLATAGGVTIELEVWMPRDVNATVLRWTRTDMEGGDIAVRLRPLLAGRDHHPQAEQAAAPELVTIDGAGSTATITWRRGSSASAGPLEARVAGGRLVADGTRVAVVYPEEAARGTGGGETLHVPLAVEAALAPRGSLTLVVGTVAGSIAPIPSPADADAVAAGDAARTATLLAAAGPAAAAPHIAARVRAADRFLVRRDTAGTGPDGVAGPDDGLTVIAGYPWFGDWGRDTMISLPGLTLATGRPEVASRLLRTWSRLVRDGLLPNHFPRPGAEPSYHAIDAPLWFVHALGAYERATGDPRLPAELRPAVEQILDAYRDGTRYGIGMDTEDGLVRGDEPGRQLTWMDAVVEGVVMTPRHGKPVEIQALWVEANRLASRWASADGDGARARHHASVATRAARSFRTRFPRPGLGWLADVVDGPEGDDESLRPNQLLALTLVDDLVAPRDAADALDAVGRQLVVPGGVRTLAPFEPAYRRAFQGPPAVRDAAYHQGAAWTWLVGPWVEAVARLRGHRAARDELRTALDALDPSRTGAIPELLEPEPPHEPRGCPWQAWGVGELLRVSVMLHAGDALGVRDRRSAR